MKERKLLVILLLALIGLNPGLFGQTKIDTLERMLDDATGDQRIEILYLLCNHYVYAAPEKAIPHAKEFLKIAEELDSLGHMAYASSILGEAYYFMDNLDKSLEYFNKYLEINEKIGNMDGIGSAYNNLGILHREMGDFDQAIQYYQESLKIKRELNEKQGISSTLNNIGVLYEHLNLFSKALEYYKESYQIEKELNDLDGISTSLLNIGALHGKMGNYDLAEEYCQESIAIADSMNFQITLEMNYESLFNTYKRKGDYKKALAYHEKHTQHKQNRINEETTRQLAELEVKYDTEKKEKEIALLSKQKKQHQTIIILFVVGFLSIVAFSILLYRENKRRRKNNQLLSLQNAEILQQKEEIEAQRDEIEAQRDEIRRQKDIAEQSEDKISKINQDLTDSIEYAKNIQVALFPDKYTLQRILKSGFCLFKPKDIVSGDFYWVSEIDDKEIIVAADCTGHGVPGAFMSIIGITFLNEIINDEKILQPAEILTRLRKKIIKALVHSNKIMEAKDGIDMSLCIIDRDKMTLEFAGAYNHLYLVRDNMLETFRADKMPVGFSSKAIVPFTNYSIKLEKNDMFYILTDGYADQFGGPNKKKFRMGNMRQLFLDIHQKSIDEQKMILYENFLDWKEDQPQIDDVLVLGFRI